MRKDGYANHPVVDKGIILTKPSSSRNENNRWQEATTQDVDCNREAVLPRTSENPNNQGEPWDQEPARSASKLVVGRSNTRQREKIGDPQEDQTQRQEWISPSMSDGTQASSRRNDEKIRQPL